MEATRRALKVAPGLLKVPGTGLSATRFYLSEGCTFSGWVVRDDNDRSSYSDPLPNEAAARQALETWDDAAAS